MNQLTELIAAIGRKTLVHLQSPALYAQISIVLAALLLAWMTTRFLTARLAIFRDAPPPDNLQELRVGVRRIQELLLPTLSVVFLGVAILLSADLVGESWLVRGAQGASFIYLLYRLVRHFIKNQTIINLVKWIGIPFALLYIFGWLDQVTGYLDGLALQTGNIRITASAVLRAMVFGILLFWLGRVSNTTGQRVIRQQPTLDTATREIVAKLFEIGLFIFIFLLFTQVIGIDLTALAVFGGALGVGLGFGLQQIASNFISGLIILLDRSITVGDYIQLEDGRAGILRELTMRSATLETYDGKDIMVPNERFITTAFTNWTHNNKKQRYSLRVQVSYATDIEKMFDIIRKVLASHPQVLSGEHLPVAERPDAEIENFGDSGINILIEYWMAGIDDGANRVGADLLLMIWMAFKENGIEMPFPQREVKILRSTGA